MGSVAISEISNVVTSSLISSSPSCRLPINRKVAIRMTYISNVRKNMVIMKAFSCFLWVVYHCFWATMYKKIRKGHTNIAA